MSRSRKKIGFISNTCQGAEAGHMSRWKRTVSKKRRRSERKVLATPWYPPIEDVLDYVDDINIIRLNAEARNIWDSPCDGKHLSNHNADYRK